MEKSVSHFLLTFFIWVWGFFLFFGLFFWLFFGLFFFWVGKDFFGVCGLFFWDGIFLVGDCEMLLFLWEEKRGKCYFKMELFLI